MTVLEQIPHLDVTAVQIEAFCRKWGIVELAVFGSVLRDDFAPESDIDVLVRMHPETKVTFGTWDDMEAELSRIAGRKVDFVFKKSIERSKNWLRRRNILDSARIVYAGR